LLNYITEQFRYVVIHVAEADNPKAALRARIKSIAFLFHMKIELICLIYNV